MKSACLVAPAEPVAGTVWDQPRATSFYAYHPSRFYNCDWILGPPRSHSYPVHVDRVGGAALRLTFVHPCIGRRRGDHNYIRTWQMEPLPPALLAGHHAAGRRRTLLRRPDGGDPFDEPTDLVAISVETYTARARLPDRSGVPAARSAGGDGRLPRHPLPRRGRATMPKRSCSARPRCSGRR